MTDPGGAATTYTVNVTRAAAVLQQAYVKASNTDANDIFGCGVAVWGDTLAVAANFESSGASGVDGDQSDNSAPGVGAVYVFTRTGTTWTQQAYLKASNTGEYDQVGGRLALSGDTLAVSAGGEYSAATGVNGDQTDDSAKYAGAVYVFTRFGSTWSQQAYIKASNTGAGDQFGSDLALWGDSLAVGAWLEDSAATGIDGDQAHDSAADAGAVYVFTRAGTTWSQQTYAKASNNEAGDELGGSVALWGDSLAVGAQHEDAAVGCAVQDGRAGR